MTERIFRLDGGSRDSAHASTGSADRAGADLRKGQNKPGTDHWFAYRVSVPTLVWGNYYFTVFAGPERRNLQRLAQDGQTDLARRSVFFSALLFLLVGFAVFGGLCATYLIKSALNIDLFEGGSFLHPLFEQAFQ